MNKLPVLSLASQLLAAAAITLATGKVQAQLYWQPQANGDYTVAGNYSTTTPSYTANANTINANWIVATFNTASPAFQPTTASTSAANFVGRIDILNTSGALTFGGTGVYGVRRGSSGVAIQSATSVNQTFSAGVELGRSGTTSALDMDLNNTGSGTVIFNGALTARAGELNSFRFTAGKWALNGALNTGGKLVNIFGGSQVTLNVSSLSGNNEYRIGQGGSVIVANSSLNNGWFTMGNGTLGGAAAFYLDGNGTTFNRWIGNNNVNATYTQTIGYKGAGTATINTAGTGNVNLSTAGTVTSQFDSGAGTLNINTGIAGGNATGTINKIGAGTVSFGGADANTYNSSVTLNVNQGTLALGKSAANASILGNVTVGSGATLRLDAANQIADNASLSLNGGLFDAQIYSETLGTLSLLADSSLLLGSSAALEFANSAAQSWGSSTLTIYGTIDANTLRFGTDNTGLTSGQLSDIIFADYGNASAQINFLGYIAPVPEPQTLALALGGGLALLACGLRRR